MRFYDAVRHCYRNYFVGRGRAGRAEYWWFVLFGAIGFLVLALTTIVLASSILKLMSPQGFEDLALIAVSVLLLYFLTFVLFGIPLISAQVRRLHDIGRTGYWAIAAWVLPLLSLVFDGGLSRLFTLQPGSSPAGNLLATAGSLLQLLVLVMTLLPSQTQPNKYGPPASAPALD